MKVIKETRRKCLYDISFDEVIEILRSLPENYFIHSAFRTYNEDCEPESWDHCFGKTKIISSLHKFQNNDSPYTRWEQIRYKLKKGRKLLTHFIKIKMASILCKMKCLA